MSRVYVEPPLRFLEMQFSMLNRDWYATVEFRAVGEFRRASATSDAETPEPDVERVRLLGTAPEGDEVVENILSSPITLEFRALPFDSREEIERKVEREIWRLRHELTDPREAAQDFYAGCSDDNSADLMHSLVRSWAGIR